MTSTNNVNGFMKGLESAMKGIERYVSKEADALVENYDRVAKKAGKGDLIGAGLEALDQFSIGGALADAGSSLGLLHGEAQKQVAAGIANFVTGNAVAATKEFVDAIAIATGPSKSEVKAEALAEMHAAVKAHRHGATAGSYPKPVVDAGMVGKGYPHLNAGDWTARSPIEGLAHMQDMIKGAMADLATQGASAAPKGQVNGLGAQIDAILNNPNLSFEDMLELVLRAVVKDSQEQIKGELKKLGGAAPNNGTSGASGVSATPATAGKPAAPGGFDLGGIMHSLLNGGGDLLSNPATIAALTPILEPLVTGALLAAEPVGPALIPFVGAGLPIALGAIGQGMKAVAPAVDSGASPTATRAGQAAGAASQGAAAAGQADTSDTVSSREEAFERIKQLNAKMDEMQQAMSNILNAVHDNAMNAIRNIK